ncbi:MAG: cysteine desulfurase [Pseudomonadota bacterium]
MNDAAIMPSDTSSGIDALREDFPVLYQEVNGKPLVYLDSAASSQRPRQVIDAVADFERRDHANVHRGVHILSQRATERYEGAREKIRAHLNATSTREIVFTRGTTEAINLVAQSYARPLLNPGDEVLITYMEHHSNIVPWQQVCEQTGATLKVAPITESGALDVDGMAALISDNTKFIGMVYVSNALGTVNPVKRITALARERGIPVLVDGAQAMPHLTPDVADLGCDFFAFSGHKMYAPTGIGALWGREALLEAMPPWQGGGDMILAVRFDRTVYNELPYKFEAGTPNISGAVGLGAALDYLNAAGLDAIAQHEAALLDYAHTRLQEVDDLRIVGTAPGKVSVASFVIEGIHPHDIGTILDTEGVAIRTGHHCAQPVMEFFGVPATARASLGLYNNRDDIDRLVDSLQKARRLLGRD